VSDLVSGLGPRIPAAGRGRVVAVLGVGAYFTLLFARGGHRAWGRLGVWILSSPFLDMRSVTSAWECARRGVAVLPANPCDPLQRPANYPSIWLLPSHLGLGQSSTVPLGIATAIVFFVAALAVIPRNAGANEGLFYGLALCSPSIMLGVERGNVDLLIFALVVPALALLRREGRAAIASPLLLLFTALLKLFPIVAAVVLLRRPRRRLLELGAVVAAFGVYALATLGTIQEIRRVVPQSVSYSYGIKPFGTWASNLFATYGIHLAGPVWEGAVVGSAFAIALMVGPRLRRPLGADDDDDVDAKRALDFFVAGAVIYVVTFCFFQNFEYRLVFLLLTIPQLWRWARRGHALGVLGLVFVLLTLWLGAPWSGVPVVETLMSRWQWLTSRRPFSGVAQPLSSAASAQVVLAIVMIAALAAVARVVIRRARPSTVDA
jgi:hypothetical protein